MYRGIGYPLLPRFWTAVRPFVRSSRIGKNNRFYGRLAIIERDHGGMGQHFTWDFLGLRAFISHLNSFLLANTRLRLRNPLYYLYYLWFWPLTSDCLQPRLETHAILTSNIEATKSHLKRKLDVRNRRFLNQTDVTHLCINSIKGCGDEVSCLPAKRNLNSRWGPVILERPGPVAGPVL